MIRARLKALTVAQRYAIGAAFAADVLPLYESACPGDSRVRNAIEAARTAQTFTVELMRHASLASAAAEEADSHWRDTGKERDNWEWKRWIFEDHQIIRPKLDRIIDGILQDLRKTVVLSHVANAAAFAAMCRADLSADCAYMAHAECCLTAIKHEQAGQDRNQFQSAYLDDLYTRSCQAFREMQLQHITAMTC